MSTRPLGQHVQFVPPLGEALEQREVDHRHVQIGRDRCVDGGAAGQHPQHEAAGDGQDVDDDDVLEDERVGQLQAQIAQRRHHDPRAGPGDRGQPVELAAGQQECRRDAGQRQQRRHPHRRRARQLAAGQRTEPLLGVPAIALDVGEVVDEVDGARDGAERQERHEGAGELRAAAELPCQQQGGKHERVLGPLARPQAGHHRPPQRAAARLRRARRGSERHRAILGAAARRGQRTAAGATIRRHATPSVRRPHAARRARRRARSRRDPVARPGADPGRRRARGRRAA